MNTNKLSESDICDNFIRPNSKMATTPGFVGRLRKVILTPAVQDKLLKRLATSQPIKLKADA